MSAMTSEIHPHEQHGGHISHETSGAREKYVYIAIAINLVIVGIQVTSGIFAGSLGLLADAGHNFADVAGLILAVFAIRMTRKSSTHNKTYGFHRTGVLAAQANAALILLVTGFIAIEGIQRLMDPHPVKGGVVVIIALGAAIANIGAGALLHKASKNDNHSDDLNMRAATLHLLSDGAASVAVLISGLVIMITDSNYWLDPLMSLGIGCVIAVQAVKLLKNANDVLMESVPSDIDVANLESALRSISGVASVHDLHAWSLSTDMRALSVHVVIDEEPTLRETHIISQKIRELLSRDFNITHATIECEVENN